MWGDHTIAQLVSGLRDDGRPVPLSLAFESAYRLEELESCLHTLLSVVHKPNPTDPKRIDVRPGHHKRFGLLVRRVERLTGYEIADFAPDAEV